MDRRPFILSRVHRVWPSHAGHRRMPVTSAVPTVPLARPRRVTVLAAALQRNLEGWLFASPWIIGFPVDARPHAGLARHCLYQVGPNHRATYIGLDNFRTLANDSLTWQSLKVTLVYAITSVPLHIVFGMVLALMLNTHIPGSASPHRLLPALGAIRRGSRPALALALFHRVWPVQRPALLRGHHWAKLVGRPSGPCPRSCS